MGNKMSIVEQKITVALIRKLLAELEDVDPYASQNSDSRTRLNARLFLAEQKGDEEEAENLREILGYG